MSSVIFSGFRNFCDVHVFYFCDVCDFCDFLFLSFSTRMLFISILMLSFSTLMLLNPALMLPALSHVDYPKTVPGADPPAPTRPAVRPSVTRPSFRPLARQPRSRACLLAQPPARSSARTFAFLTAYPFVYPPAG